MKLRLLAASVAALFMPATALASMVVPVTMVWTDRTICSSQAIATANNVNDGDEFERNDAKARADADSRCDIANNVMRNVTDALNKNFNHNLNENFSHDLNRSFKHNLNKNIHDAWNRGSMLGL